MTCTKRLEMLLQYGLPFRRTFGVPLDRFLDQHGFDLFSFDQWLEVPYGQSVADIVKDRYGDDADALVRKIKSGCRKEAEDGKGK